MAELPALFEKLFPTKPTGTIPEKRVPSTPESQTNSPVSAASETEMASEVSPHPKVCTSDSGNAYKFLRIVWDELFYEMLEILFPSTQETRENARKCWRWFAKQPDKQKILARALMELIEAQLLQDALTEQFEDLSEPRFCAVLNNSTVDTFVKAREGGKARYLELRVSVKNGRAEHLPDIWPEYRAFLLSDDPL